MRRDLGSLIVLPGKQKYLLQQGTYLGEAVEVITEEFQFECITLLQRQTDSLHGLFLKGIS